MSTTARLSLGEYDRMIAGGVFETDRDRRLELIRGEIREMVPPNPPHEDIIDRLASWSFRSVPQEKVRVRVQNSIGLPELESAPQPDLAWVAARSYARCRPTAGDVLLVIEVAHSSLSYDTGEKADLYAAALIADYWVVNLPEQCIEVRRDPHAGRYRSLQTFCDTDEVRPLAMPSLVLHPATLWQE
ncbi:MAG: Uma2 family endonuclease [Rhodopirellula sp.]|nr:Uma2 family endonuclease [Rhodopirellula sp.]